MEHRRLTKMKYGRIVLLLLFWAFFGLYQTSFAADTSNVALTVTDLPDRVVLSVTLLNASSPEANAFSQAYDMVGLDVSRASFQVYGKTIASRDVNVFFQGSGSLLGSTFASFYTRTELDDVDAGGTTPVIVNSDVLFLTTEDAGDTTKFVVPDAALLQRYIRFQADGQTSNPAGSTTTIKATIPKIMNERGFPAVNRGWKTAFDTN